MKTLSDRLKMLNTLSHLTDSGSVTWEESVRRSDLYATFPSGSVTLGAISGYREGSGLEFRVRERDSSGSLIDDWTTIEFPQLQASTFAIYDSAVRIARGVGAMIANPKKVDKRLILDLSDLGLTSIPASVFEIAALNELRLHNNQISEIPAEVCRLTQLDALDLSCNTLTVLPEGIGTLRHLTRLDLHQNPLVGLPESISQLAKLEELDLRGCGLTILPEALGKLTSLTDLRLGRNSLTDLPRSLLHLRKLAEFDLIGNPLNPELGLLVDEKVEGIRRYLATKAQAQTSVLNEAKLFLIGEGEVGKSCLLGALRGESWEECRPSTHGIEIKTVKVVDPTTGSEITLNGWDFGGQRIYRPTHQFFFSTPAIYLVVWKPREGSQQGFVKDWIKLVKHREPDAKILVVATHGGPKERQPDIDRQEIWDFFGRETVINFFHVDSKTGDGVSELKKSIASVAASLPEVGRTFPKHWREVREKLRASKELYLSLDRVIAICKKHQMEEEDARLLLRICHRVGDLIHYEHDPALRDIVVLKPDSLATAISYVLDDKQIREAHGLVKFARLTEIWDDPARPAESRYEASLHPFFLRLMERFDLSCRVVVVGEQENTLDFWQRVGTTFETNSKLPADLCYTSLIAQLVPDVRPEADLTREWPERVPDNVEQQVQICRIVEAKTGESATAEGLFYQLIVRLYKYSLGRVDYKRSVHWQRGLVLDDDYNGRALLELVGNDVRVTVRAPYPQAFMAMLTREVKWLVESFWKGMRCDVMVPCIEPCGRNAPGTGLYNVRNLIESKREERATKFPCPVCNRWQNIDALLRNAPVAQSDPVLELLLNFQSVKEELAAIRPQLLAQHGALMRRFDTNDARILSRVDAAYAGLMRGIADDGKDGPRLFSLNPIERSAFNPKGWVKKKFKVTLWCEHSRLPLPFINKNEDKGVYELEMTREWFAAAAPFLKVLAGTLSLVLPVASSATKLPIEEAAYKTVENQLEFGKESAEAMLKVGEKTSGSTVEKDVPEMERTGIIRAEGDVLREFQSWLKKEDPTFGDLRRVLNKRQEFLWVHPQFEKEY